MFKTHECSKPQRSDSRLLQTLVGLLLNASSDCFLFLCQPPPSPPAGTTCLMALLSDRELTVANVGDSRGVLCDKDGNAVALSHDHKPYQLKERKRIKRAGTVHDEWKRLVLDEPVLHSHAVGFGCHLLV